MENRSLERDVDRMRSNVDDVITALVAEIEALESAKEDLEAENQRLVSKIEDLEYQIDQLNDEIN